MNGGSLKEGDMLLYNSLRGLHLLDKADTHRVVSDLMGLQAQFANYPKASLLIRASDYRAEDPFYGLVKIWSHRGTMHLVPEDELGLHLAAFDNNGPFVDGYWGISRADADYWAPFIEDEIGRGNNTRDGLKVACADAGMGEELLHQAFYGWGGLIREMVTRGRIVCGTGTQKEYFIPKGVEWMDRDQARRVFLRRYFEHYGPATVSDCRYFFGNWKKADMDPLLKELLPELVCTVIGGKKYFGVHDPVSDAELPPCVLVPGFDQLILGYKDRDRMIDRRFLKELTNISGIVSPSVLVRGRIRARWKLTGSEIVVTSFDRRLKKDEAAIRRKVREVFSKQVRRVVFTDGTDVRP